MRITLLDSRQLAVFIYSPTLNRYYNASTGGFETPFNPQAHLLPMVAPEVATAPAGGLLSVDTGTISERTDLVTVVCTTTGSGTTLAWAANVDCVQGPPLELPVRYAWSSR